LDALVELWGAGDETFAAAAGPEDFQFGFVDLAHGHLGFDLELDDCRLGTPRDLRLYGSLIQLSGASGGGNFFSLSRPRRWTRCRLGDRRRRHPGHGRPHVKFNS
jgi:hypothetical protein